MCRDYSVFGAKDLMNLDLDQLHRQTTVSFRFAMHFAINELSLRHVGSVRARHAVLQRCALHIGLPLYTANELLCPTAIRRYCKFVCLTAVRRYIRDLVLFCGSGPPLLCDRRFAAYVSSRF